MKDSFFKHVNPCPRCGAGHEKLQFQILTGRHEMGLNYWAQCPVTNQPMLRGYVDAGDHYEVAPIGLHSALMHLPSGHTSVPAPSPMQNWMSVSRDTYYEFVFAFATSWAVPAFAPYVVNRALDGSYSVFFNRLEGAVTYAAMSTAITSTERVYGIEVSHWHDFENERTNPSDGVRKAGYLNLEKEEWEKCRNWFKVKYPGKSQFFHSECFQSTVLFEGKPGEVEIYRVLTEIAVEFLQHQWVEMFGDLGTDDPKVVKATMLKQ